MTDNSQETGTGASNADVTPEWDGSPAESVPTFEPGKLMEVSPKQLVVHPDLLAFPGLTKDEYERLKASISDSKRVIDPIKVNTKGQVLDGRNRRQAADDLKLATVPVLVMPDSTDPIEIAIITAVDRRQLTKSAIALVLFESHPELRGDRDGRKKRCLTEKYRMDHKFREEMAANYNVPSYRKLAERYQVPRCYFSKLAEIWDFSDDNKWAKIRVKILDGEACIDIVHLGFRGGMGMKSRAAAHKPPEPKILLHQVFKSLAVRIGYWEKVEKTDRKSAMEVFRKSDPKFLKEFVLDLNEVIEELEAEAL